MRTGTTSWHTAAKCAGHSLDTYILDTGPGKVMGSIRDWTARQLCAGCPVTTECLADAQEYGDTGVVRGGRWLSQWPTEASRMAEEEAA